MNTYIYVFLFFVFLFSSCNDSKKTDITEKNIEQVTTTSKQKVEKLEVPEFQMKMMQLQVYNLIDVRTPQEFAQASIIKSKNINFNGDTFEEELSSLEKEKPLFIYCKSGGRSAKAVEKAKEMGFERIIELDGGMDAWKESKAETQHSM